MRKKYTVAGEAENGRISLHRMKHADDAYTIVRKKDVKIIHTPPRESVDSPEHEYPGTAAGPGKRRMRTFIITLKGKGEHRKFASHKGEQFILVQRGSIKVIFNDREETLLEGDSIYCHSRIPHRIENLDTDQSVILAVFYADGAPLFN